MNKKQELALNVSLEVEDTLGVELTSDEEIDIKVGDTVDVSYNAPVTPKIDENSTHEEAASAKAVYEFAGKTVAENVYFDDGQTLAEKYVNGELGGGGGGVDDEITLTSSTPTQITVAKNSNVELNYTFTREVYTARSGIEKVYVDGVLKSSRSVSQGENNIDITKYLTGVEHTVELQVTSSGLSASLLYEVEVIELSISSTFDGFAVYGESITYRYTPVGNITKEVHFILDDEELDPVSVADTGKTMIKELTGLSHGTHTLTVYCTATIGESTLTSNILNYAFIVNNGGTTTLIGCPFTVESCVQGDLLEFNYVVCDPANINADVNLSINGEVVNSLVVDRTKQTWSTRNYPTGTVVFEIQCNECVASFVVNVTASEINVEPITNQLEVYYTSTGRSNNEAAEERVKWSSGSIEAELTGFNWKSNGWMLDNSGDTVLRVNGGARVNIPVNLFGTNFINTGKTIEFEFLTNDIRDYDSILISCKNGGRGIELSSSLATFASEQTLTTVNFKESEKVRIAFVVEAVSENRFIYTYINGVLSGLTQYPDDDNFAQTTPVGITIGSDDATIDIYNIRVYGIDLDHRDVLTNYIADTQAMGVKTALYTRNDVFDAYGNINYSKVLRQIPCLTIIGELPPTKGDKKTVSIKYENMFDSVRSFSQNNVTLDIQGTSSQYYPRKNYKFKLRSGYQLTNSSILETVFCLKADFMESSHSHNTGLAKIVNGLYPDIPPKEKDNRVQAAITGFPIVVWHRASETAPLECLGVYNFNNDKDDVTTFGYTKDYPNCESWEFKNNTSGHCLFQNDNFVDTVEVAKNFEARYPDKYTNYTALSRVVSWVKSTQGDLEKFKNEFENYFDLDSTLLYYCLTDLFAMVDSRAKNLFLTTWNGSIWYPTFYDMDTAFGLNNEGRNEFDYNVEYHDVQGTQNVFNGESSVLWNNFEQAFADEITEFYNDLRNQNKLTYDSVMKVLYDEQISKVCESLYNYDAIVKYKNPLLDSGKDYLYAGQGNRLDHLKWWLYNRFNYKDSEHVASEYQQNYITLRIYTPEEYGSVTPNADVTITPYADQYVKVKYDENMFGERCKHDESVTIDAPNQVFNDTPLIIYGASRISDIGDLSPLYAGTVDVSAGVKLKELIIGNSASDYSNTNLKSLTVGNNELLTKLDVRNCPSLTQVIDLSGCKGIEEIYATGTSTTSVKVPNGGNLKKLHLPNTITNLTLLNQPFINDFVCGDFSKINTLRIENTPVDTLAIVQASIDKLERVRLLNIDWTLEDSTLLEQLMTRKGLNENGVDTDKAVLSGKVHISGTANPLFIDECVNYFGNSLVITADEIIYQYKATFVDYDGNTLYEIIVNEGETATYVGDEPTKPNDTELQEKYEFADWTPSVSTQLYEDTVFTPVFNATKYWVVEFQNWDGTVLQTSYVDDGGSVEYTGETPTRPDSEDGIVYTFKGWNKDLTNITSDMIITAVYSSTEPIVITYNLTDESNLNITFYMSNVSRVSGTVDWGDGTSEQFSLSMASKSHTYSSIGVYVVKIMVENYVFQSSRNTITMDSMNGNKYITDVKYPNDLPISQSNVFASKGSNFDIGNGCSYVSFDQFYNLSKVDFRRVDHVIPAENGNVLRWITTNYKIIVPDALYDEWIVAEHWEKKASHIVKASEYEEV